MAAIEHTHIKITLSLGDLSGVDDAYAALSNDQTAEIAVQDSDLLFSEHEARELVAKIQSLYQAADADPAA